MSAEPKDVRAEYVEKVKAMGQEIINRADDIIGEFDMVCGLSVSFNFSLNNIPTLKIEREYISKELWNVENENE